MGRHSKRQLGMNRNKWVLIKNFFFLGLLQIMRYFIPIIILPYITRVIGVEHFGELSVATASCFIIQVIVDYGFNYMGAREVATNKTNLEYISHLYSTITFSRCFIFLVCSTVMMLLTYIVPTLAEIRLLVFIALFPVLMSIFMPEWIYQGLEEMEFITYTHVVSRIVYVVLIFTLIKEEDDYVLYPVFNVVGLFLASLASLIILRRKNIRLHFVSFKQIRQSLLEAKDLFLNDVCSRLLTSLYSILVGNFLSFKDSGIYSSCSKLIVGAHHGQSIINRVFYPFLARHRNKYTHYFFINLGVSAFIAITGFLLTPFIYTIFYPESFHEGIMVMRIMTIGLLFSGISGSLGSNYLIIRKKERIVRNVSAFTLVFGASLYTICLLKFGLIGATVGALCVTIIRCLLLAFYATREMKKDKNQVTVKC